MQSGPPGSEYDDTIIARLGNMQRATANGIWPPETSERKNKL